MSRGRILPVVLALSTLAGCSRQVESPAATFSIGSTGATYTLSDVDGQALPALAYFGVDVSVRATGGTLTLNGDHSYALDIAYTQHMASGNTDRTFTQTEQGTWTQGGLGFQLTPKGGTARQAMLTGDRLTVTLTVADESPPERATKSYTFVRSH